MPTCIVVFADREAANHLNQMLQKSSAPIRKCQLIKPLSEKSPFRPANATEIGINKETETGLNSEESFKDLQPVEVKAVPLLNPKLSRKQRQQNMALWLMPFGFLAGLTFTQMTGLDTFAKFGLNPFGESFVGGLLGMGSGLLGSYVSSATVNPDSDEDLRSLLNRNKEGKWLLLLETSIDVELPWQALQEANPIEIVRLRDL